jgi:hypothetical protein
MEDTHWISVEDNPPPAWTPVLAWNVIVNKKDGSVVRRCITCTVKPTGFETVGEKSRGMITHWMPLPAPPTDDK